jgi:hypothetical protein
VTSILKSIWLLDIHSLFAIIERLQSIHMDIYRKDIEIKTKCPFEMNKARKCPIRSDKKADKVQFVLPDIQPTHSPSAMQMWRRSFATSVTRLNRSPIKSSHPSLLRCAQILQSSKAGEACRFEDQEVKINGFIRSVRKQKRFAFAEISDGSTLEPLQAILKPAQAVE